ncbi:heterogeneous nuclear ribonucleoprotein L-like isoform 2-T2 [Anomaloglossus baeobatrachus]|uniref:heterogeneous nuclear ribonucleoprotein L-like isoform X2 n=1 Tax=Anomaloglossus baeobatrachus TaxID=238106 RepID=UPI003F509DFF
MSSEATETLESQPKKPKSETEHGERPEAPAVESVAPAVESVAPGPAVQGEEDGNYHKEAISPVVHVRGLLESVLEADLVKAIAKFGTICYVAMMPFKRQALVEFENNEFSKLCVNSAKKEPIFLGGQRAYFSYSSSKKISRPAGIEDTFGGSNVLLVSIHNAAYPVSVDIIYSIFNPVGKVERIVIFRRNTIKAMVEFDTIFAAQKARAVLNGTDLFAGCGTLIIEYARPTRLNVYRNNNDSWDYSKASGNKTAFQHPDQGNGYQGQPFQGNQQQFHNQGNGPQGPPFQGNQQPIYNQGNGPQGPPFQGNQPPFYNQGNGPQGPPFQGNRPPFYNEGNGPQRPPFQGNQPTFHNQGNNPQRPPFQGNQGPFQGNQGPFQGNQGPFQGNQGPFQGNQGPFQGNQGPFQGNQGPFQGNQGPFQGNQGPFQGNQGPFQGNQGSFQGNKGPFQGNKGPFQGNQGSFQGNQGSFQGNQGSFQGNQGSFQGNQGSFQGNQGPFQGNQGPFQGNQGPFQGNQGPFQGNQGPFQGNQGPFQGNNGPMGPYPNQNRMGPGDNPENSFPPFMPGGPGGLVAMVGGLHQDKMNCDRVFNLFCLYGNVSKIKFMKSIPGQAFVEMTDEFAVKRVVGFLNMAEVFGKTINVCVSKQHSVIPSHMFQLRDGSSSYKEFGMSKLNRFTIDSQPSKNTMQPPSCVVRYYNAPLNTSESDLLKICEQQKVPKFIKHKAFEPRQPFKPSSSGLLEWKTKSEALEAVIVLNHYTIKIPYTLNPYTMKMSFSAANHL